MQGCLVAENCLYEIVLVALHDDETAIGHALSVRNHSDGDFVIRSLHFSFSSWGSPEK